MLSLASSWNSGLCRHDMTIGDTVLTPPQLLALRHAPTPWRDELRFLLLFDARMQSVVIAGREPLLTRMKLAWWREALNKSADQRPKGEPLLAECLRGWVHLWSHRQQNCLLMHGKSWRTRTRSMQKFWPATGKVAVMLSLFISQDALARKKVCVWPGRPGLVR
jgi:hypothetical protein